MKFFVLIVFISIQSFAGNVCSRDVFKKHYQQAQMDELVRISGLLSQKTSPAKLTAILQDYEKTFREFPRLVNKYTKEKTSDSLAMVKDNGNWVILRSNGTLYEVPNGGSQYAIQKRVTDPAYFHDKARAELRKMPDDLRSEFGKAIFDLQNGETLSMPISRHMPNIGSGVSELRVRTRNGAYRVFYYTKADKGVVVFHVYQKQTESMPLQEVNLARQRLKEMLDGNR